MGSCKVLSWSQKRPAIASLSTPSSMPGITREPVWQLFTRPTSCASVFCCLSAMCFRINSIWNLCSGRKISFLQLCRHKKWLWCLIFNHSWQLPVNLSASLFYVCSLSVPQAHVWWPVSEEVQRGGWELQGCQVHWNVPGYSVSERMYLFNSRHRVVNNDRGTNISGLGVAFIIFHLLLWWCSLDFSA